jgi:hypothetical protein
MSPKGMKLESSSVVLGNQTQFDLPNSSSFIFDYFSAIYEDLLWLLGYF